MRATDFQSAQGGRYYLTPGQFADLLRASTDIDPAQTLFVLFSDQNFLGNADFESLGKAFAGLNHVLMQGSMMDDLVGIGSCDIIVGPASSTFSRWAAFARNRPWAGAVRPQKGQPPDRLVFEKGPLPWGG